MSAMVSSEQVNFTAPLKSPSSFEETREAKVLRGSWGGPRVCLERVLVGGVVEQFVSSLSCLLIAMAKDRRWPRRGGDLKHREQKRRRRSQAAWSLSLDTASRIVANFTPASSLEALGILLIIPTGHLGGRGASTATKQAGPNFRSRGDSAGETREVGRQEWGGTREGGENQGSEKPQDHGGEVHPR